MSYFNCHNHTHFSNIRLLDCINRPKDLIDKAIELGLSGIAITDHECLSSHMEVNMYAEKIREQHPDFVIGLGNEIYLTDTRDSGQRYYHFILIAKDLIGHRALNELSSTAWINSYTDRGMERVPLLKSELSSIMEKYKGHLIATTACIGGELGSSIVKLTNAEAVDDKDTAFIAHSQIVDFMNYCIGVFGEDFYIECAPSDTKEQILVNQRMLKISKAFGVKVTVGTDSHYLTKEDRYVHKAYLNSKGGEREVDSFYEFARLMDEKEVFYYLNLSYRDADVYDILDNSLELMNKITSYTLKKTQKIPEVEVKNYPKITCYFDNDYSYALDNDWVNIKQLLLSDNPQERYWINECLIELQNKNLFNKMYLNRIEIEADVVRYIGNKLNYCLFSYFNTFKHYIDLFWECGSIVGPGRGSATGFLSNYLLGITQLDPIRWGLPYWRFLNKERAELPDIDIDLAPSKRPSIFSKMREERGYKGVVQVGTFGTEGTKSTVLTACRGFRSEEYPEGIDSDIAQYMSSLIPSHRGFLWRLKDVIDGNIDEDRKPVKPFIHEVNQYPGLLDIMLKIEGLVNKRSSHASGVILYDEDPYDTSAFMKTPSGDLVTQFDLHMAENAGDTKYDLLLTEVSDKIIQCLELMVKDEVLESDTLRNLYNKYLHPEILNTEDQRIWDALASGNVLDVFQFNSGVGLAIVKKVKPQNPIEMTAANALMRLMTEKGEESQQDRFYRIKMNGLDLFEEEMRKVGLDANQRKVMHQWCDEYYGCVPTQELMMEMLMDIAGFTLAEANDARKIVAKKQMSRIPELKEKLSQKMSETPIFSNYFWKTAIAPSLGYAFSLNHSLPYSFVGIQTLILAVNYNPIYWNTACLIVNSGATDEDAGSSTDYGKIAKAIGDIMAAGIQVSLADINLSDFGFKPDAKNNKILFGLKGMLNVGDDIIREIIANRPYISFKDFINRVKINKQPMIALIKGGAFDTFNDRKFIMAYYIWNTCDKKQKLTLQNFAGLIRENLIPEELDFQKKVFEFNRYLKAECKNGENYVFDDRAGEFYFSNFSDENISYNGERPTINQKAWDKIYQEVMNKAREYLKTHQEESLDNLNTIIFKSDWDKYAKGSISSWEMEALCFYYHEHELVNVDFDRYGIVNFFKLPEEPVIEKTFNRKNIVIPIYKLNKICGTCIAKNKTKSTVSLLTVDGVVTVKFRNEYFSMFDKQISERRADGTKKIVEKSWFNRGNMIVVQGIRRGDEFIPKKYASSVGHQLYKIVSVLDSGELILTSNRYKGEVEDGED